MNKRAESIPVIQRVGNMGHEGALCHIDGRCYRRVNGIVEPISKEEFDRAIQGQHCRLETWDPLA